MIAPAAMRMASRARAISIASPIERRTPGPGVDWAWALLAVAPGSYEFGRLSDMRPPVVEGLSGAAPVVGADPDAWSLVIPLGIWNWKLLPAAAAAVVVGAALISRLRG